MQAKKDSFTNLKNLLDYACHTSMYLPLVFKQFFNVSSVGYAIMTTRSWLLQDSRSVFIQHSGQEYHLGGMAGHYTFFVYTNSRLAQPVYLLACFERWNPHRNIGKHMKLQTQIKTSFGLRESSLNYYSTTIRCNCYNYKQAIFIGTQL